MFEHFEPIFAEPKPEWAINSDSGSAPTNRFLMHVFAPDCNHLKLHVTDFRSNTFEAVKSVMQLEDMRDSIGIGESWSEFVDYFVVSLKSEEVKLVLETKPSGPDAYAKLVAQKSKGMPRISISLRKLVGSAASDAAANTSFEIFEALKCMKDSVVQERSESTQSQLGKGQKLEVIDSSAKRDASALAVDGSQNSPDKKARREFATTRVTNRVVPAFRRAKVRGALLQDIEDDKDN